MNENVESKDELLNALKQNFATTVNKVYFNSIQKEYCFREITVMEQKTLSRIMLNNERRKDVIYDAQCALMNDIALDKSFDIYKLSEFDKIKLMLVIYNQSIFKNDVDFVCSECGASNRYQMDFSNVVAKLDKLDISDKVFEYSDKNNNYKFIIAYPSTRKVSRFYSDYMKQKLTPMNKNILEVDSNIEYMNLFIKSIQIQSKNMQKIINLDDYKPMDIVDIISIFPQDIFYNNENGLLNFITKNFIQNINDLFDVKTCFRCGAKYDGGVNSVQNFL